MTSPAPGLGSDPSKATCAKNAQVQPAPAAAPSEFALADEIERELFAWRDMPKRDPAATRACAYAIAQKAAALFAPILAEKSLHHETGERITRKDLNNAYREGSEKGRLAAHLIDGVNSPLNACCYRDGCRSLEARALAAESALANERERCAGIASQFARKADFDPGFETAAAIAAAIRAQP